MMNNPYYLEARGVPQQYGTYTGAAMQQPYGTYTGTAMQQPYGTYTGAAVPGAPMAAPGMNTTPIPGGAYLPPMQPVYAPGGQVVEESYIENILRLNLGKVATVYTTYENNAQWNAKIFKGVVEAAGRDHIIISDPLTGMRYLILMVNLDYVTFDEELKYSYPARTPEFG